MKSGLKVETDPRPILACTVCRDVQNFDLLIVDMEEVMGDQWGDLGFSDALTFFDQAEAQHLEFIALAIDDLDEDEPDLLKRVVIEAKKRGIRTLLIAEDVTPALLHQLLRMGADEFIPYPPPSGELMEIVETLRHAEEETEVAPAQPEEQAPTLAAVPDPEPAAEQGQSVNLKKDAPEAHGVLIATHGLAGGVGASTLATNLAWEMATVSKKDSPSVCLIDFDLQFGSISTYLDLPRRDAVLELLTDTESMDSESFGQALQKYEDALNVLTSPTDMVPLDLITNDDVQRVLDMACRHFDFVVVDMPTTIVQWTEVVLQAAHVYFALTDIDMRSAQNTMRMKRALQAEDMPFEKLRYVLNRAPKFTDLAGKSRVKRMSESLGISIEIQLPDGGKAIPASGDHGQPLALSASKNPLRREIAKLAKSLVELEEKSARVG
ncbi:MAG: AAA family ATPase [Cognatishimia activa]